MRLICPNCVAQYEVDDNVIPPEGRDVQCANCGHNWFQDSVQMFTHHTDVPAGTGDPDSDVPPELFNDLEGRLDTDFAIASTQTAPDPNDMEPEEARDDFQIEQELEAPSSRLDQDVLDVLRSEAEYSSGEKPPAAIVTEPENTTHDDLIDDVQDILQGTDDTVSDQPTPAPPISSENTPSDEQPDVNSDAVELTNTIDEPDGIDDLDEIRRRIMELEAQEETIDPSITDTPAPKPEPEAVEEPIRPESTNEPNEELTVADLVEENPTPEHAPFAVEYVRPESSSNPFSRPTASGARDAPREPSPSPAPEHASASSQYDTPPPRGERIYEENIPYEEHIPSAASPNQEVVAEIETLVAEQTDAKTASDRPRSKVAARPFPNLEDSSDELYGASQDRVEARKDLFPDVDELSSEIASEAENGGKDASPNAKPARKPKSSFLKGFKYALLLCIIIGVLYMLQPVIVEYIPQAEGFLGVINKVVNMVAELIRSIAALIQGMIG